MWRQFDGKNVSSTIYHFPNPLSGKNGGRVRFWRGRT